MGGEGLWEERDYGRRGVMEGEGSWEERGWGKRGRGGGRERREEVCVLGGGIRADSGEGSSRRVGSERGVRVEGALRA